MKTVKILGLILVILIGNFAFSQGPNSKKPDPNKIFNYLDTNKDNKISKAEAKKAPRGKLAENFNLIDTNKDGFIDRKEISKLQKK